MILEQMADHVESVPDRCSGQFVLKGTRFPISQLIAEIADGCSVAEVAEDFELDVGQLQLCLNALAYCVAEYRPQPPVME